MDEAALTALTGLAEPVRRRLYAAVVDSGGALSRDDAAAAIGIGRSLAAYHLDRLVADGLLAVTYERRNGRTGPGAGRPAKMYRRATEEVTVQIPARDDAFVGSLLAGAVEADQTGAARRRLNAAASKAGRRLAPTVDDADALLAVLRERGYEPTTDDGAVRLKNCPFHHLVDDHRDLVCTMNLNLLRGVLAGSGVEGDYVAALDPQPDACCVVLRPRQ